MVRWMGPTESWPSESSTTSAMTRSWSAGGPAELGPALGLVGERGLVAVMAVGDHHRGGLDGARDLLDDVGRVEHPQGVDHPVVVDGLGMRRAIGLVGGRQPARQRQAPDGGEVGPARPQQVEPVALVLRDGLLVGQDVASGGLARQRPDDPGGGPAPRHRHPVRVEGGPGLGREDSVFAPGGEDLGRGAVLVQARSGCLGRGARRGWRWRGDAPPARRARRAPPRHREGR